MSRCDSCNSENVYSVEVRNESHYGDFISYKTICNECGFEEETLEQQKHYLESYKRAIISKFNIIERENYYMKDLLKGMLNPLENGLDIQVNSAFHKILKEKYGNQNN